MFTKRFWLASVVVVMGLNQSLVACGDKFLILGRGTRFERPALRRQPATIVIYAQPSSGLAKALADLPIRATLEKAGYTSTVVTTSAALDEALRQKAPDLLLLDLVDAPGVDARLGGDARPAILPVVFGKKDAEVAAALKQFTCAVKSPGKNQSFLEAVDEALAIRRQMNVPVAGAASR